MTQTTSNYNNPLNIDYSQYDEMQENPLYLPSYQTTQSQPTTPVQIFLRVGDSPRTFFSSTFSF